MRILVHPGPDPRRGYLYFGGARIACALGNGGVKQDKREGDGATPAGCFPLRGLLYRPSRSPKSARLPARPIGPRDGWCDDPGHPAYNRFVRRPHAGRSERLWRADRLYDLIFVIGYNDSPPHAGRGSAVFLHTARPGLRPTEGCVAVPRAALRRLAGALRPGARIEIKPPTV